jgi:hypothetical protein
MHELGILISTAKNPTEKRWKEVRNRGSCPERTLTRS